MDSKEVNLLKGLPEKLAAMSHRLLLFYFLFALALQVVQFFSPDFFPFWFKLFGFQIFLMLALVWLYGRGWRPLLTWNIKIAGLTVSLFAIYFLGLSVFEFSLRALGAGSNQALFQGSTLPVFILQIFLAPVFEELFFRDYLTRAFYRQFSRWTMAVFFSSAFFMLSHFSLYPGAFLLGLINAILLIKLRSVWPCILFHSISNLSWYFLPSLFPAVFQWLVDQAWLSFFFR